MASNNCTNTFRSLICIVDIGNIHKGTRRIIIFPRFIWAYKAGAIISDVAMHFEPCHGLIRPYIFLFNSLMTIINRPAAQSVFNTFRSYDRKWHSLVVYLSFCILFVTVIDIRYVISAHFDCGSMKFYFSQIRGIAERVGFQRDVTIAFRDSVLNFGF